MKRVRYLAGVAGIAPVTAAALGAGAAPATAQPVGHGKTVSMRAVPGHQAEPIPAISLSFFCRNDPLRVHWGAGFSSCWVNPGSLATSFWNFKGIYTGNNQAHGNIRENGRSYACFFSKKNTSYPATWCRSIHGGRPNDNGTMVSLRIP